MRRAAVTGAGKVIKQMARASGRGGSGCARVLGFGEASAKVARASGSESPDTKRVTRLPHVARDSYKDYIGFSKSRASIHFQHPDTGVTNLARTSAHSGGRNGGAPRCKNTMFL